MVKKKKDKKDKIIAKAKQFLFKRNQATIILPKDKLRPILRRSELFNKEYEREKNLLGWK